ncbi:aminomuconate-semialdehyde/2-hydroxymuconate-6-semialdehyde dehydrogenase [Azospirillum lipoferum]|uniref:2-hydroxymuconic semialdehyde dehydrogenase n=1 Tax=Azospirillum lipoferum TaxID=193 RepID=A0A5A9GG90_AZOLI|nr:MULTISPECIES: 2-hydroxymuconic semialdehyde dehydrogenase [Azospirillum]KAA0592712.1 2-hydroxymuconic semialdehyde dehydrogenase [Azospirillum lipoferum]MCP1614345.1 aminomuconate-semialdehyde/2-hydroxymuconate-6-semialdehyde dehydrogenase [Azospirillum lipoferum]MDW5531877.1 2-hydroxymuconic semialdehyde dehydrogenase [Azospirillum sp. NL1]
MAALLRNFAGNSWIETGRTFANVNPVNGTKVCDVSEADAATVARAVAAARRAVEGDWGRMGDAERAALLHKVADRMEARFDDFLAAEIADTGKSHSQARTIDIPRGAANFRIFADLIRAYPNESYEMTTPDGAGALNYSVRRPLGVVAVIAPWNLPLLLLTWKVAPAMAAGNAVIAKPSEETPSTATLLAEVMQEVGIPAGAFNLVHGFGPGSAGELLTTHPGVDAITFTGESRTGTAIMKAAADRVKPISFELGGKNPAVIFADCDFDATVEGMARAVFTNCGQVCMCTERVYVERPIFDRFVRALKEKAEALVLGRPEDAGVDTGPLISAGHRDKVLSYFRLAVEEGATVVTGGGTPRFGDDRDDGFFVQPTIWTGLGDDARVCREEIFGPVCHIAPFDSEEEAIARANDTDYGLCASIWTQNLSRGHRVARRIEAGLVWINSWYLRDLRTPFGGVKLSGIGREGGVHSLNFYSEPSNICIKL